MLSLQKLILQLHLISNPFRAILGEMHKLTEIAFEKDICINQY
jgi:hypothetical protein